MSSLVQYTAMTIGSYLLSFLFLSLHVKAPERRFFTSMLSTILFFELATPLSQTAINGLGN